MELSAIGPYRVIKKLGAGGQGEVYLAEDPRLDRKVALKRISVARINTTVAREALRLEAKAAAKLNHPNIAVIYDVIEVEQQPFIVMEYVEGQPVPRGRANADPAPVEPRQPRPPREQREETIARQASLARWHGRSASVGGGCGMASLGRAST